MACIYILTNKVNGKKYIGQTSRSFENRFNQHIRDSKNGPKFPVDRAINKYGENNFRTYIYECDVSDLDYLEVHLIKIFRSTDKILGYNLDSGGNSQKTRSKSTKRKISESLTGKRKTKEHIANRVSSVIKNGTLAGKNNPMFGKTHKQETIKKMREVRIGKYNGKNSPLKGRKFSEEHKKKISENKKLYWEKIRNESA